MSNKDRKNMIDRRKVLQTTGAALGGGLALGATGTAAASSKRREHGSNDGSKGGSNIQQISTDGDIIVTLVESNGEKFLFREAAAYRNADDVSAQSAVTTYEATESGYPVEYGKIDSSVSASVIESNGSVQAQAVDFTPENFLKRHDVDTKKISDSCGDLVFNNHHALEIHLEGGGAFSSLGVSALSSLLCYVVGSSTAIPTGGLSAPGVAVGCGLMTTLVDQAVDVEAFPNTAKVSVNMWDEDESQVINTSPTIAWGVAPGWETQWHEMRKDGEYDENVHLGLIA